jgi:hypothetical protein
MRWLLLQLIKRNVIALKKEKLAPRWNNNIGERGLVAPYSRFLTKLGATIAVGPPFLLTH